MVSPIHYCSYPGSKEILADFESNAKNINDTFESDNLSESAIGYLYIDTLEKLKKTIPLYDEFSKCKIALQAKACDAIRQNDTGLETTLSNCFILGCYIPQHQTNFLIDIWNASWGLSLTLVTVGLLPLFLEIEGSL